MYMQVASNLVSHLRGAPGRMMEAGSCTDFLSISEGMGTQLRGKNFLTKLNSPVVSPDFTLLLENKID